MLYPDIEMAIAIPVFLDTLNAGTGKSTLVKFIISALNIDPDDVAYIAFTGKAADVLRQKGNTNSMTAHKLLFFSKKLSNGNFVFKPKISLEKRYKLIVVDEISMLDKQLWELLLRHRIHIIALGDPFQIPPIRKEGDNHVLDAPHIFLDEVMRQAKDNEIVQASMKIRNFEPLIYGVYKDVQILHPKDVVSGMYTWADQILCATNTKRNEINNFVRKLQGRGKDPEEGDKIISLSNHWDCFDDSGAAPLVNGTIGYLGYNYKDRINYPIIAGNFPKNIPIVNGEFITENGEKFNSIRMDYMALLTGQKFLTPQQEYLLYSRKNLKGTEPFEFNYGYGITVHRAQGSQWNKILVFEERFPFDRVEHAKWLYTACTRGVSKLVLIRSR